MQKGSTVLRRLIGCLKLHVMFRLKRIIMPLCVRPTTRGILLPGHKGFLKGDVVVNAYAKGFYSVAKTHRMPKVAGHVSPKANHVSPLGQKRH